MILLVVSDEIKKVNVLRKQLLKIKDSSGAVEVTSYLLDCLKKNPSDAKYGKILYGVYRGVRDDYAVGLIPDDAYKLISNFINDALRR